MTLNWGIQADADHEFRHRPGYAVLNQEQLRNRHHPSDSSRDGCFIPQIDRDLAGKSQLKTTRDSRFRLPLTDVGDSPRTQQASQSLARCRAHSILDATAAPQVLAAREMMSRWLSLGCS